MSYTGSQASSSQGGKLEINTTGSTYVQIAERRGDFEIGQEPRWEEVTNEQSGAVEYIAKLPDGSELSPEFNYVPGDAGQEALIAAALTVPPTKKTFKYTDPLTGSQVTAETLSFQAFPSVKWRKTTDSARVLLVKFKVTGVLTRVPAA